jgi:DNA helicase-2/ATP-dependent DNA helicase PcrA
MSLDLTSLNDPQRDAVLSTEGPLLVLAGAGSGKTRVLTFRIAHIVRDLGISPAEILAITFTNKAAAEMRERLGDLIGPGVRSMWVMTFHAMCVRMLRLDADLVGFTRSFSIYDEDDRKRMVKSVMADLEISEQRYPVNAIVNRISTAKNELVGPPEFSAKAFTPLDKNAAKTYERYQRRMRDANAMDFDDLLFEAYRLLAENPKVLESYRDRFRYISVDEYQDTNHSQYSITNLLADAYRNLMVVGDDDQSIYSWRGADIRNILEFEKDYPDAKVVKLEQNYRSTVNILTAANAVIAHNTGRKAKSLYTTNVEGERIAAYLAADERDEARFVTSEIDRLVRTGDYAYGDVALFYRTHAQSRVLEDLLLRTGVPYRIVGGTRFFDRAEIRDVMAYLKVVVNPADEISLRRIINTPRRGIGETTIDKIAFVSRERGVSFEDALRIAISEDWLDARARTRVSEFAELLDYVRSFEAASLRDLVEAIVERSGLISALDAERTDEAAQRADNIREFFGVVQEFSEAHPDSDLPEFLEWLALRTDLDTLVEGESAVTMMTVHTAKGLEFPVVFIVGLEESIFPHANSMFDPVGLEEERRLMYVAITRARQRLYLAYAHSRSIYGSTQHNPASRFLAEMPEETLEKTGVGSMGLSGTGYEKRGDRRGTFGVGPSSDGGRVFGGGRGERRVGGRSTATGGGRTSGPHTARPKETFAVGDVVDHKTFGQGRVVEVNGDQLSVKFARSGDTKKLLLGYAPIVKIKQ